ncbi:MAG: radical SAM protein [Kiritimatiellaeota bacterium]|nr:radical SAM protein [Kiritimatiellota bacterium]
MRICLLYPKWTTGYSIIAHFAKKGATWPPLNLAYLAAMAENAGHAVRIIDAQCEDMSPGHLLDETGNFKPDIIGITSTTPFHHVALALAKELKHRLNGIPIIIGGPHITVLKEAAFDRCFDYGFVGEADKSWPLFLERYANGRDVSDVKGILFRKKGEIIFTGEPDLIDNVDAIPLPARHLLKNNKYKIGTLHGTKNFTTIMTTRGCPYKCIFCSTKVFGKKTKSRSPGLVVDEIKSVVNEFNIRHFIFLDDTLTLNRQNILEICELLINGKIKITFEGSTRANLVDEELVSKLAAAGLIRLSFGLESVDDNIRRIMRKEVPLESYIQANKLSNKYGIETLNSCMIGLPGETRETIRSTLSFLRHSREIKQANISIAVPYPGTELYEMAKRGDYDLKLEVDDFSKFRRYNVATMSVGDLSPSDLVKLQNSAFASIYIAPWRWVPVLKKSGIIGLLLTFYRLIKSIMTNNADYITNKQLRTIKTKREEK